VTFAYLRDRPQFVVFPVLLRVRFSKFWLVGVQGADELGPGNDPADENAKEYTNVFWSINSGEQQAVAALPGHNLVGYEPFASPAPASISLASTSTGLPSLSDDIRACAQVGRPNTPKRQTISIDSVAKGCSQMQKERTDRQTIHHPACVFRYCRSSASQRSM
jgi:hypothetical protein